VSEVFGPIDYERLARAVGRANRADAISIDLNIPHAGFPDPASLIAPPTGIPRGLRVNIVAIGLGVFWLTLIFQDGSNITFANTDLTDGDILDWDFAQLYVTNAAQPGLVVDIIVDYRVIVGIGGF
jgi:hypothetical protein